MPYLQLEINKNYPIAIKQFLAKRMCEIYSSVMITDVKRVTVTIRQLGEGSVWRCSEGQPWPAAILMCDVRAGRTKEVREELAKKLIAVCNEILKLEISQLNVEFTKHAGDEMYHQ